ncbi:DUF29 domain-containing protein [Spirulina sp. 06S082]|uniref:DUF29 domain-containing protein n=1 Tax=Spirulina sp. 06S082 TaxID=3110248 RepID=UPI002B1FFAAE|nr:DUF29 domain-containing protein [Spirulina sp. 06S082]MEA5471098.1 DUF29 domain-containing protein [Spirulina sp. 06S082]
MVNKVRSQELTLYEQDFNLWLEDTVMLLREQKLLQVDWENLIAEIEGMGRSEKNALKSNLRILLMHLLKYRYQPEKRTNSWRYTISKHRQHLEDALEISPSLTSLLQESLGKCYQQSRKLAADETGLPLKIFPSDCPFLLDDILDLDYLPDEARSD